MTFDVLFSLSFSLKWRKEKSILEFERNSPPTRKRETHTITSHERARKLWEKKGRLKTRSFLSLSLFFSLFQRRRERMNQRQQRQQQQQQHLLYKSMGESDSFSSFFSLIFLLFLELRTTLVFLCVSVVCSFLFFFFEPHKKNTNEKTIYTRTKTRVYLFCFFCLSFACLLLVFFLSHSLSFSL